MSKRARFFSVAKAQSLLGAQARINAETYNPTAKIKIKITNK